jgi:predicted nuclease with TOPRIM domain
MSVFSGKVIEAHYIDESYNTIEIIFQDGDTKVAHVIENNPDSADYKALIEEGWDEESILDDTAEFKRRYSREFNTRVNMRAREILGIEELEKEKARILKDLHTKRVDLEKKRVDIEKTKDDLTTLDQAFKMKTNKFDNVAFEYILDNNTNKEAVFKLKLWSLEQDIIRKAPKEIKSKIRRSNKITEVISIINTVLD